MIRGADGRENPATGGIWLFQARCVACFCGRIRADDGRMEVAKVLVGGFGAQLFPEDSLGSGGQTNTAMER